MSQVFRPSANTTAKISILFGVLLLALGLGMLVLRNWSPYTINGNYAGIAVAQPIRFSHELHSGQLNISCMYCHQQAEISPYGAIPDVHTCMSCHAQIAVYSELLADVRSSYETGEPIEWLKVHDLAEHIYFNHSVHVSKGFACTTCHGPVDEMPQVWQANNMYMGWCLDCHLNPEEYIRPVEARYLSDAEYEALNDPRTAAELIEEYNVEWQEVNGVNSLTNCSTCHR